MASDKASEKTAQQGFEAWAPVVRKSIGTISPCRPHYSRPSQ